MHSLIFVGNIRSISVHQIQQEKPHPSCLQMPQRYCKGRVWQVFDSNKKEERDLWQGGLPMKEFFSVTSKQFL